MANVETRYMLISPGGAPATEWFDDEDTAIAAAAGYDPAWGVIPVYVPDVRTDDNAHEYVTDEEKPAPKRRAAAAKTETKTEPKASGSTT
jgi:hypothetical protein